MLPSYLCPPSSHAALPQPPSSIAAAASSLGLEGFRADLHFHTFEGIVGSMPAIPGDAIHVLPVLPQAVVHPIEVGVCATVVPVATWHERQMRLVGWGALSRLWLMGGLKAKGTAQSTSSTSAAHCCP